MVMTVQSGENAAIVRTMTREEVNLAVDWARQEGWNPGLHDAEAFYAADPHGFFIATCEGTPVGTLSVVAYDEAFAFGGFYIVKPEFRGKGIGMKLWRHGMSYLGSRNMGGDGVVERLEDYAREGLALAHNNIRFEGIALRKEFEPLHEIESVPFASLVEYDTRHFPAKREHFLRKWIVQPEGKALCIIRNGKVDGYGVLRKCFSGYKVGPLFAPDLHNAERILRGLLNTLEGETFYLDVPEPNRAAMQLASDWSMREVFRTGRIYSKKPPELPLQEIFGVTSFELG